MSEDENLLTTFFVLHSVAFGGISWHGFDFAIRINNDGLKSLILLPHYFHRSTPFVHDEESRHRRHAQSKMSADHPEGPIISMNCN